MSKKKKTHLEYRLGSNIAYCKAGSSGASASDSFAPLGKSLTCQKCWSLFLRPEVVGFCFNPACQQIISERSLVGVGLYLEAKDQMVYFCDACADALKKLRTKKKK